MKQLKLISLGVMGILLIFFGINLALADEGGEVFKGEKKGYHVALNFVSEIALGSNEIHVQITGPQGQILSPSEVTITVQHLEESEQPHNSADVKQANKKNSMSGMEKSPTSVPESTQDMEQLTDSEKAMSKGMGESPTAVPEKTQAMEQLTDSDKITNILEPEAESGEYKGELTFDRSGEWLLTVRFPIEDELLEVPIPINIPVSRDISKNTILSIFLFFNIEIILLAAVNKFIS